MEQEGSRHQREQRPQTDEVCPTSRTLLVCMQQIVSQSQHAFVAATCIRECVSAQGCST